MRQRHSIIISFFYFSVICFLLTLPSINTAAATGNNIFAYIAAGTCEYSGKTTFSVQNTGMMTLTRQKTDTGYAYTFLTDTRIAVGDKQGAAESKSPPIVVLTDSDNRKLAGGYDCLKNFGLVGNAALSMAGRRDYNSKEWTRVALNMDTTPFYPARPVFKISYARVSNPQLGQCLISTAVSDIFVCKVPDEKQLMTGRFRVVLVTDPEQHNLYYRCSGFEASLGSEKINAKDNFWIVSPDTGRPVDMSDILAEIEKILPMVGAPDQAVSASTGTVPPWGVHALAVKKYMDVTAGAALEGQPNIAPLIAIGGLLLVDSAVSTGSELLAWMAKKAFDKDIFVYKGIPSYLGQAGGWGAAAVYEKVTGNKTDREKWKTVGGDIADVAAIFLSSGVKAFGVTLDKGAKWGIRIIDAIKESKVIQIGKYGLSWAAAEVIGKIFDAKTAISKAYEYLWPKGEKPNTFQPGGTGGSYTGTGGGQTAGGVSGGLTFSLDGQAPPVRSVVYDYRNNEFIINGSSHYQLPLPPGEIASIFDAVNVNRGFGYSQAAPVRWHYQTEDDIGRNLKQCDWYLGSLAVGIPENIPSECVPDPDYKPVRTAEQSLPFCFQADFNYQFGMDKDRLYCKKSNVSIAMVPILMDKARQGIWERDEAAAASGKVPQCLEENARHLVSRWNFYAQTPVVSAVTKYGEAAVFAGMLQQQGVKIGPLAAEIRQKTGK